MNRMPFFSIATFIFIIACMIAPAGQRAEAQAIDLVLAEQYFKEAEAICRADAGKLWGVSLCGPMIFADPATRTVVANQPDTEGRLVKKGSLFVGKLPDEENCANTATRWAGVYWTMVIWPLPEDERARARLMAHELFHRIQEKLMLPLANPANNHLDASEGRLWLQMEWRALASALTRDGAERRKALEDALLFRAYRRQLFAKAEASERALEMNEGLAEYTGVKLRGATDAESMEYLARRLKASEGSPTFVRSFAYATGPAYGFLLDGAGLDWRKGLKPESDFGALAEKAFSIKLPGDAKAEAEKRSVNYDGIALRAFEAEREANRRKRVAQYRARFIEGPVLVLPLTDQVQYSFNPNNVEPLDEAGMVYPTLRVSDLWGVLTVSDGALVTREGERVSRVYVSAPADPTARKLEGEGWTLELKQGWKVEAAGRKGDYSLKKSG